MTGIADRRTETCIGDETGRRLLHDTGARTDTGIDPDTTIGRLLLATAHASAPIAVHAENGIGKGCLLIIDIPARPRPTPDDGTRQETPSTDEPGGPAPDADDTPTVEIPAIGHEPDRRHLGEFLDELRRREERIRNSKRKKDRKQ